MTVVRSLPLRLLLLCLLLSTFSPCPFLIYYQTATQSFNIITPSNERTNERREKRDGQGNPNRYYLIAVRISTFTYPSDEN